MTQNVTMAGNITQLPNHTTGFAQDQPAAPLMGLISFSTRTIILDVISCGIEPFPWILGLFGNLLSLIVLWYQGIQQTTNIILISLALSDLMYVLLSTYRLIECVARHTDLQLAADIDLYSIVFVGKIIKAFAIVSRYHTCFIAVERFIVVQFPLRASAVLKRNRIIFASVVLWVFAFLSYVYTFLLFEADTVYNPSLNRTEKRAKRTDFMVKNLDVLVNIASFVHPVFSIYLPVLLVLVCTCFILRSLRLSALQRSHMGCTMSSADVQQRQITQMLVSICIVFLITNFPDVFINMARLLYMDHGFVATGRYRNIHAVTITTMLCFNLINSSVNVVFYVIFNRKFRSTCQDLFGFCLKSPCSKNFDEKTTGNSSKLVA